MAVRGKADVNTKHMRPTIGQWKERATAASERLKNEATRKYVTEKLKIGWTPEQVEIRIGKELGKEYSISYEAIYQFVYSQIRRGGNGKVKDGCED